MAKIILRIMDRCLAEVPVWENLSGAGYCPRNWVAEILLDDTKPAGLDRLFWQRSLRGGLYYFVPERVDVGTALEFGADLILNGQRKRVQRCYGFVVSCNAEALVFERTETAEEAVSRGKLLAPAGARIVREVAKGGDGKAAGVRAKAHDAEIRRDLAEAERAAYKDEFARRERAQEEKAFLSDPDYRRGV